MDMLGHVNNVTYVDYLQEARIDMLATHAPVSGGEELAEGVVVVSHDVVFLTPLVHRARPVQIEVWVTRVRHASLTMAYEIFDETADGGRTVYLRATSVLAPFVFATDSPRRISDAERGVLEQFLEPDTTPVRRPERRPRDASRHAYPLNVRWSDVDAYRHVNNVAYFEFFQEARISYLGSIAGDGRGLLGHGVAASTVVDYRRPILFRLQPYAVHSWVSHVGSSSFTISGEIRDGDEVLATARVVMVAFDKDTQRSAPLGEGPRAALVAELSSPLAAP